MVRAEGGSLRFWGPGLLSTSPAFSMSSASHSAGSSGWLAPKTGAGPTFQWAGKVDAICRSRSNRAKRPRAGCILRSSCNSSPPSSIGIISSSLSDSSSELPSKTSAFSSSLHSTRVRNRPCNSFNSILSPFSAIPQTRKDFFTVSEFNSFTASETNFTISLYDGGFRFPARV